MKKKLFFANIFYILVLFASCNVGLGKSVDTNGPVVTITSPNSGDSVSSEFILKGNVSDNESVWFLTVTVKSEAGETLNTWRWIDNLWQRKGEGGSWESLNDDANSWIENRGVSYDFSVRLSVPKEDGKYSVEVIADDEMANPSSLKEVSVVVDSNPPALSITQPNIEYKTLNKIKAALDKKATYKEYAMLDKYLNGDFEIKGIISDKFNLKAVAVHVRTVAGEDVFCQWIVTDSDYKSDDFSKYPTSARSLSTSENAEIKGGIRQWNMNVSDLFNDGDKNISGKISKEKQYLEIYTEAFDQANNAERKTQGYICYWPEADTPWVDFSLMGSDEYTAATTYSGTVLQGYAYDDDAIKSVQVSVKGGSYEETYQFTEENGLEKDLGCQSWEFDAPINAGIYSVTISARDKNGVQSEIKSGYIKVVDASYPKVIVTSPEKTKTLFGDANGDFMLNLTATDDSGVTGVKAVLLSNEEDSANFNLTTHSAWDLVNEKDLTKVDSNGNRLFYIKMSDTGKVDEDERKIYKGSLGMNLFKSVSASSEPFGLGIDGKSRLLLNQHFIFMVEDTNQNRTVEDCAILGDIEPPTVALTKITTEGDGKEYPLGGAEKLPQGTSVATIHGEWSDDSMLVWNDKDKLSSFKVFVGIDEARDIEYDWSGGKGTFRAKVSIPDGLSLVPFSVQVSDFAGNQKNATNSIEIDGDAPALRYITSGNANGSYKVNQEIKIALKFNKKMYLKIPSVSAGTMPKLKLNNNKYAVYESGDGGMNHIYKYKVESGDDVAELDVVDFEPSELVFGDKKTEDAQKLTLNKSSLAGNTKFSNNKKIEIVTKKPEVEGVEISSSDDGDTVTIKFSQNIVKGTGKLTITQKDVQKVPPVLTEERYKILVKKNAALATYYEKGTNGADSDFKPDTSAKYVLKYDYKADDKSVVDAYKAASAHIIEKDVKSQSVSVDGKKLVISLKGSDILPCKGAEYSVKIPSGIVQDRIGQSNENMAESNATCPGIEKPVIRVQKSKWTYDKDSFTATQPLTANYRAECATPGASLTLSHTEAKGKKMKVEGRNDNAGGVSFTRQESAGSETTVPQSNYTQGSDITIGNNQAVNESDLYGQVFKITAKATKGSANATAYEVAYRSVIYIMGLGNKGDNNDGGHQPFTLHNNDDSVAKAIETSNGRCGVWLRGGESINSDSTTPGFPLSWNTDDYDNTALLTQITLNNDEHNYYYVTWEINVNMYVAFLAGSLHEDSGTMGPKKIIYLQTDWNQNRWVDYNGKYWLEPGESVNFATAKDNFFDVASGNKIKTVR